MFLNLILHIKNNQENKLKISIKAYTINHLHQQLYHRYHKHKYSVITVRTCYANLQWNCVDHEIPLKDTSSNKLYPTLRMDAM